MQGADPTPTAPRDPYAALRYRDFRLLIGGQAIAQLGEQMVSVGVGWELYDRTGNPLALGLIGLAQIIPVILLSVPGGYIVDRYNRKRVMLVSQLVLIACSLSLMVLSLTHGPLPLIYATLAIIGTARAFNNPAESALTSQTVPAEHYFSAAAWNSSIWQLSAIVGPALGELVIGVANRAAPVYLANAIGGVVLVTALLLIRSRQPVYQKRDETPWESVRAGWSFLRRSNVILASITLDMFAVLFGGATFLLPVFAKDILHVDASGLGILRAAPSVGALLMATTITRRPPFRHSGRTLLIAVSGFGIATIVLGVSTSFWLSIAMLCLLGALDNISVVIRRSLVLIYTPDEMRGRVGSVNSIFVGASNELGGFESGVAAALLGPVGAVAFGGIGTLIVVAAMAVFSPQLRRLGVLGEKVSPTIVTEAEVEAATEKA